VPPEGELLACCQRLCRCRADPDANCHFQVGGRIHVMTQAGGRIVDGEPVGEIHRTTAEMPPAAPGPEGGIELCARLGREPILVGTEQPTNVRIASLVPTSDSDADPVPLVTLSRVAAGLLRLVSWRLHKTVIFVPIGPTPIGHVPKP